MKIKQDVNEIRDGQSRIVALLENIRGTSVTSSIIIPELPLSSVEAVQKLEQWLLEDHKHGEQLVGYVNFQDVSLLLYFRVPLTTLSFLSGAEFGLHRWW